MGTWITLEEARALPPGQEKDWAYNALDVTGTLEIAEALLPRLNDKPNEAATYAFERAIQAPALAMMLTGVLVDAPKRAKMVEELKRELKKDERAIAKMPIVMENWDGVEKETGFCPAEFGKHHKWDRTVPDLLPDGHPNYSRACTRCGVSRFHPKPFEANSTDQVQHLIYDILHIPPMENKQHKASTDDDILDRLGNKYETLKPLTDAIRAVRDKNKQLGSLNARLSRDGRYPSSFNVGAAWTGRFSSSKNPYGLGGNLQNVAERHRGVFVADPGKCLGYADYMQGESNLVAHLSGDPKYIEAHKLGDVHTYATRLIWKALPWTWDLKADKKIAKTLPAWDPVPGHDFRFQAKRIQHGSNYLLSPRGIFYIAHIPIKEAESAQRNYFSEFEFIPAWQRNVIKTIREHGPLINPFHRKIVLMGRPWDEHTWKQGCAFLPQSALAEMTNISLWLVWYYLGPLGVEVLAQVHDAILFQYPRGREDLAKRVAEIMSFPVHVTDFNGVCRVMRIGSEVAVGKNWGHYHAESNPEGLKEI